MKPKVKLKTILSVAALVVFASLLLISFEDSVSSYMNFEEVAAANSSATVVGEWVRPEETSYNPTTNVFNFYLQDDLGEERMVHFYGTKPANFEEAEKLVVQGQLNGEVFEADHILTKCPSKYNDAGALESAEAAAYSGP